MKKNLIKCSLITLLAIPFMVGCNAEKGYKETRTEEEIVNELANVVVAEIGVGYSKFSGDGVNLGDNALITTVNEKVWEEDEVGLNFTIKYSLTPMESYPRDYLYINEAGDTLTSVVVGESELEGFPTAKSLGGAAYTLKAKVTFAGYGEGFVAPSGLKTTDEFVGKEIVSKNWNALVKTLKSGTITEVKESAKGGEMALVRGRVSAAYNWIYEEVFRGVVITDGDDGVLLYAGCLQTSFYESATSEMRIHLNDIIEVYGEVSPYNGIYEIKPRTIRVVEEQDLIDAIRPTAFRNQTIEEFNEYEEKDTGALATVHGLKLDMTKIALKKLSTGEHWVINLKTEEGVKMNLSLNYHVGSDVQEAVRTFLSNLGADQTFSMNGMVSATSNKIEISGVVIGNTPVIDSFTIDK